MYPEICEIHKENVAMPPMQGARSLPTGPGGAHYQVTLNKS
jgi:hypothetical protein